MKNLAAISACGKQSFWLPPAVLRGHFDISSRIHFMLKPTSSPEQIENLRPLAPVESQETGAAGYILLWLLGVPVPVLVLIFLLRGCS